MVDTKKEQERDELHRAIWAIADELRGAVDGWDFKNYVLGTMFYRYISENLCAYINKGERDAGNPDFDYANMSDAESLEARADLVQEKGFFIPPSELFCNVLKHCTDDKAVFIDSEGETKNLKDNLNEFLESVFNHIEESSCGCESESDFKGLFDDIDVNSNKLGATVPKRNERLVKLLEGVAAMDLGSVQNHEIDAFGDAYEFLMQMYASNAGKSGGEFFTPADVSVLLTRLGTAGKTKINKAYDPACGSGSLLLKVVKILGRDAVQNGFYGQEINITTFNLCRINMFLHNVNYDNFDIQLEDTLLKPQHMQDAPFDAIVSNPPYSLKWEGKDNPILINDERYAPAGVLAPKNAADLAFTMHMLWHLSEKGTAAIVEFPGVLYRGGDEKKIRQYLVKNNFVDTVIQLPSNLFFGVGIATCIIVLKKSAKTDASVLFIDASKLCQKDGNKNVLLPEHQDKIMELFQNRQDEQYLAKLVKNDDILENDANLSVSSYVEQEDTREVINIAEVNTKLEALVTEGNELNAKIEAIIKELGE